MSIDAENKDNKQILWTQTASRIKWVWIVGTGTGSLVGAGLATWIYRYVDVLYSNWFFFRFSLIIGAPIALFQWLMLRFIPRYSKYDNTLILFLWIPVTYIGIVFLIYPLRWILHPSATHHFHTLSMLITVAQLIPAMLFLAVGQWLILRQLMTTKFTWVVFTIIGAAIGLLIGSAVSELTIAHIPLEVMWAFVASVIMASFQWVDIKRT